MCISAKRDFSLKDAEDPKFPFKYMRNKDSFKASLVQVSNDGWEAFACAHKNMYVRILVLNRVSHPSLEDSRDWNRGETKDIMYFLG